MNSALIFISKETDEVNSSRQWAPITFAYRNVHYCCPPPYFYSFSSSPYACLGKTAPVVVAGFFATVGHVATPQSGCGLGRKAGVEETLHLVCLLAFLKLFKMYL